MSERNANKLASELINFAKQVNGGKRLPTWQEAMLRDYAGGRCLDIEPELGRLARRLRRAPLSVIRRDVRAKVDCILAELQLVKKLTEARKR